MNLVVVYSVYALISLVLTIFLARTLFRHGAIFLEEVFEEPRMAEAVNRLLVVGFYLVNFGYALLMMVGGHAESTQAALETLAVKVGSLLLSLAVMHFANLYIFHRIRRRAKARTMAPPVVPHGAVQKPPENFYGPMGTPIRQNSF